jgi:hypothetical protein
VAAPLIARVAWTASAAARGEAPLTFRDGYARPEVLSDVAWLAARAAVGAERYYRSMVRLDPDCARALR